MKRLTSVLLGIAFTATLSAQTKPAPQPAKPAPAAPAPAAPPKLVAPIRGEATLEVMKPKTEPVKNNMVTTTIKVRNAAPGAIAGLKVQEFWYDKAGNPVTGSEDRLKKPLQPGEVYVFTLQTPYKKEMYQNQYTFTHANGKIKTKSVSKIEG